MTERKSMGKKIRFEVFKRDKFTCQYCGKSAPDVILHVDHIMPISKGGEEDITNLITACQDCNLGKGARELDDDATVKKQKQQLDELQERREQLEMMVEWQKGLIDLDNQAADEAAIIWRDLLKDYSLNDSGISELRKLLRKYGFAEVVECMKISANQYLFRIGEKYTLESANKAWEYVGRIAKNRKRFDENPELKTIYYILNLMAKCEFYVNRDDAMGLLRKAISLGITTEELKTIVFNSRNWTDWKDSMQEYIYIETHKRG